MNCSCFDISALIKANRDAWKASALAFDFEYCDQLDKELEALISSTEEDDYIGVDNHD